MEPKHGFVVFDKRILDGQYLAPNTGGVDSDYTETDIGSGLPTYVADQEFAPIISQYQSVTTNVRVTKTGVSGTVGVSYSLDGNTTRRGWQGPDHMVGFEMPVHTATTHSACVLRATQQIVLAYQDGTSTKIRVRDSIGHWDTAITVQTGATLTALCILQTPDEARLIIWGFRSSDNRMTSWYSDDDGATWSRYVRAQDTSYTFPGTTANHLVGAWIGNNLVLFVHDGWTAGTTYQLASWDRGATFKQITSKPSTDLSRVNIAAVAGGAILTFVDSSSGNKVQVLKIQSIADNFYQMTPRTVTTGTGITESVVAVDADNVIYLAISFTGNYGYSLTGYRSEDGGISYKRAGPSITDSWYSVTAGFIDNTNDAKNPARLAGLCAGGALWVYGGHDGGNESFSGFLQLTGWSNLETEGTLLSDGVYVPVQKFESITPTTDWATGGTLTSAATNLVYASTLAWYAYQIDAVGGSRYVDFTPTSATPGVSFAVRVTAGGSSGSDVISLHLNGGTSGAPGTTYKANLRFTTTSFLLYDDVAPALIATVTLDMTKITYFQLWFDSATSITCYYRQHDQETWTEVCTAETLTDFGSGPPAHTLRFGTLLVANATSQWGAFYVKEGVTGVVGTALEGKTISGFSYPLHQATGSSVPRIMARGGLGIRGEEYEILPAYVSGVNALLPGNSPPSVQWVSTDTTEQIIAWDFVQATALGAGLALYLGNTNIRTAYLEWYDGADWQTAGTYDGNTGFGDTGTFDRTGDLLIPATGTDPSARYIQPGELVGGWVDVDGDLREILDNTGGWWSDTADVKCVIRIDSDGTEAASGTLIPVWNQGLMLAYPAAPIIKRRWRIRIPAQDAFGDVFKAGIMCPGEIVALASQFDWGWSNTLEGNVAITQGMNGTEFRSKLGPEKNQWQVSFTQGGSNRPWRTNETNTTSIAVVGGATLGGVGTTWVTLRNLLRETDGGSIPVVACASLGEETTITDKTLINYGLISTKVTSAAFAGDYGADEGIRIETITVDEIVG